MNHYVPIEDTVINKMKVAELRDELKKRKQITKGLKTELLSWLRKDLDENVPVHTIRISNTQNKSKDKKKKSVFDLGEGTRWKLFETSTTVEEPINPTFKQLRAPTVFA